MNIIDALQIAAGLVVISIGVVVLGFAIALSFVVAATGRREAAKIERGEGRRR